MTESNLCTQSGNPGGELRDWRLAQGVDGGAEARGQLIDLAHGHPRSIDWLADAHRLLAGIKVMSVNGHQVVDSAERHGDQRNLGANGQVGGAGKKWPQRAV